MPLFHIFSLNGMSQKSKINRWNWGGKIQGIISWQLPPCNCLNKAGHYSILQIFFRKSFDVLQYLVLSLAMIMQHCHLVAISQVKKIEEIYFIHIKQGCYMASGHFKSQEKVASKSGNQHDFKKNNQDLSYTKNHI